MPLLPNRMPKPKVFAPTPGSFRRGWQRLLDRCGGLNGEPSELEKKVLEHLQAAFEQALLKAFHVATEADIDSLLWEGKALTRWQRVQIRTLCNTVTVAQQESLSCIAEEQEASTRYAAVRQRPEREKLLFRAALKRAKGKCLFAEERVEIERFVLYDFIKSKFGVELPPNI